MAKGKFDMSEFLKPAAVSNQDTGREQIVYLPLDQLRADENNFYSLDGIDELEVPIDDDIPEIELEEIDKELGGDSNLGSDDMDDMDEENKEEDGEN